MAYTGVICIPDPMLVDTFHHQDGSTSYVVYDQDCGSPRKEWDAITVLTQTNSYFDSVDAARPLREALDRLPQETAFRYMRAFHDVVGITAWHDAAGRGGYIYVTREALLAAGHTAETATTDVAERVMKAELADYLAWADGEVYGCIHVDADGTEDSVWGFLGYDSLEEIVEQMCDSPIITNSAA